MPCRRGSLPRSLAGTSVWSKHWVNRGHSVLGWCVLFSILQATTHALQDTHLDLSKIHPFWAVMHPPHYAVTLSTFTFVSKYAAEAPMGPCNVTLPNTGATRRIGVMETSFCLRGWGTIWSPSHRRSPWRCSLRRACRRKPSPRCRLRKRSSSYRHHCLSRCNSSPSLKVPLFLRVLPEALSHLWGLRTPPCPLPAALPTASAANFAFAPHPLRSDEHGLSTVPAFVFPQIPMWERQKV